jgi:hypothetical protein
MNEMTMAGPNLDKLATKFANNAKDILATGFHIGDIDHFTVKQYKNFYSLWDKGIFVATASLSNDHIPIVDQVWVDNEYRGQKVFSKMLWFFKTRLNNPKLLLGNVRSTDMQEVVKGLSRFKKFWYKDGIVEPFDANTLDKYYNRLQPTGWHLLLENVGDFSNWPKFNNSLDGLPDYIKESYDWQIE